LFLGKYQPGKHKQHLWEISNDIILHSKEYIPKMVDNWAEKSFQKYQIFSLLHDVITNSENLKHDILNIITLNETGDNEYRICLKGYTKSIRKLKPVNHQAFYFFKVDQRHHWRYFDNTEENSTNPKTLSQVKKASSKLCLNKVTDDQEENFENKYDNLMFDLDEEANTLNDFFITDHKYFEGTSDFFNFNKTEFDPNDFKIENYDQFFEV